MTFSPGALEEMILQLKCLGFYLISWDMQIKLQYCRLHPHDKLMITGRQTFELATLGSWGFGREDPSSYKSKVLSETWAYRSGS